MTLRDKGCSRLQLASAMDFGKGADVPVPAAVIASPTREAYIHPHYRCYKSGSSRSINLFQVLSRHHSSMLSMRSHRFSSSTPYISYLPLLSSRPSRFATSNAALFSPLPTISQRVFDMYERNFAHRSSSSSSVLSGKNSRGSKTPKIARAARYKKASPSSMMTSHTRAHASKGRWSRNSGTSQSGRYAAGDTWCCLKLK